MKLRNSTEPALFPQTEPRKLRDLRGVGKSIEENLHLLGIQTVAQLSRASGQGLYTRLNELTGVRQDPCVLDTFNCAVAQARDANLPLEQTNWWWWSRERKRALSLV
jgi:hypothetical protein